jgi:hypothetical protein
LISSVTRETTATEQAAGDERRALPPHAQILVIAGLPRRSADHTTP